LQNWHKRPRVTYDVPDDILQSYFPLGSMPFKKLCAEKVNESTVSQCNVHVIGDIGMGFALNVFRKPCMSVEAVALYQIIQNCDQEIKVETKAVETKAVETKAVETKVAEITSIPDWLIKLKTAWHHPMSLFMLNERNGWRGCFAEHRLWSAVLYRNREKAQLKTPYAVPIIRSWFSPEVLNDFEQSVGVKFAMTVAHTIARMNYDGAPDLVLYHAAYQKIYFVEVKSATDTLKENQIKMMQALSDIPNVDCKICCPKQAIKKFASVTFSSHSDSE
jgi:hypothetical protein